MAKQRASSLKRGGTANLTPFPPGQSGNPGGRPKGVRCLIRSKVGENAEQLVDYWLLIALGSDAEVKKTLGVTSPPRWQEAMARPGTEPFQPFRVQTRCRGVSLGLRWRPVAAGSLPQIAVNGSLDVGGPADEARRRDGGRGYRCCAPRRTRLSSSV